MNDTLTDNSLVSKYMNMLAPLNFEVKLAILSKLSENLQSEFAQNQESEIERKTQLLHKLSGSWSDVDDSIVDEVLESRSFNDNDINFDE